MIVKFWIACLFLVSSASTYALHVDGGRFECQQGDCNNGNGVVWDHFYGQRISGNWISGSTVPGNAYNVTLPIGKGMQFQQIYGRDGLLESGDQIRNMAAVNGVMPFFRGTYGRVTHPFMRREVAVIRNGVYYTGVGIEYRGRFEYLPAKSGMNTGLESGFFIFYGDKVDIEDNETETGLYISEEALDGAIVRFAKASPSYLAVMQGKYQRDLQLAEGEFQQKENEARWREVLGLVVKLAFGMSSIGGGLGSSNSDLTSNVMNSMSGQGVQSSGNLTGDITMNLVTSLFNGKGNSASVKDLAVNAISNAVGKDSPTAKSLIKAVMGGAFQSGPDQKP